MDRFIDLMKLELNKIRKTHGDIHSLHEGLGVLFEEFDEFKAEVWKKEQNRSKEHLREELVQIAAVALRIATDCDLL